MFALHAPLATENSWGLDVRVRVSCVVRGRGRLAMNEAQSLKPDKRAKKIDSGVFKPPDPKRGAGAEKTEPTREAFWSDDDKDRRPLLFPFSSAFHSERDCHFFDMRPPRHTRIE